MKTATASCVDSAGAPMLYLIWVKGPGRMPESGKNPAPQAAGGSSFVIIGADRLDTPVWRAARRSNLCELDTASRSRHE